MAKKRAVVGAAVLAVGLLAGCSSHPGAAAIINGKVVSEKSVDALARGLNVDTQGQRPQVLNLALSAAIAAPVLAEHEDLLTPEVEKQSLASCSETAGLGEITEDSPSQLQTLCHALTLGQLDEEFGAELEAAASGVDLELSPRYNSVASTVPDYLTADDRSLESLTTESDPLGG